MKLYSETVLISKYAIGIILSASLYFLSLLSWVFYPSSAFQPSYRSLWSGVVGLHSPLEVGMTSIRDANNRMHLASDTAWTSVGMRTGLMMLLLKPQGHQALIWFFYEDAQAFHFVWAKANYKPGLKKSFRSTQLLLPVVNNSLW